MYPFNIYIIIKGGIKMLYKGKEYDENGILELLNNKCRLKYYQQLYYNNYKTVKQTNKKCNIIKCKIKYHL